MPLGEIATVAKIASVAVKGFEALKRLQPEYAKFWKSFERALKPQRRDLPWERLAQLRLDPEFVGEACGFIRGDYEKRKAMRRRVVALAKQPQDGRYDSDEIVEVVMRAADDAAVEAAGNDRDVTAQRQRLLEGQFREVIDKMNRIEQGQKRIEERLKEQPLRARTSPPPRGQGMAFPRTKPGRIPPEEPRRAEIELGRILESDPEVAVSLQSLSLPSDRLGYRPDFVVKDRQGTNWVIEVKEEPALRLPNVQKHVRRLATLTTEVDQTLSEDWRFAVVTPGDLSAAQTWGEVLAHSEEKGHTRLG